MTLQVVSPYFTGTIPALIFKNACFPFWLGNIRGSLLPTIETQGKLIPVSHKLKQSPNHEIFGSAQKPQTGKFIATDDHPGIGSLSEVPRQLLPSEKCHVDVVTRGTSARLKAVTSSPLHAPHIDGIDITPSQLSEIQNNDPSLTKYFDLASTGEAQYHKAKAEISYCIENSILYRKYRSAKDPNGYRMLKQVMVPESWRDKVTLLAHESNFGGH